MHVVATAGHVDHGKSTLVLALTGTDPDRFDEEKQRGLTIDLGFASSTLASGRVLSLVDVPGHVRFLKNMLAGVGAVDACLFVVAATEGWKPQTEEHLRILELLGIEHGVIALTKSDLVDGELRELAELDVEDHVVGTFLESAEVVAVDGVGGSGLDELRGAIDRMLDQTPAAADLDRPRLWIDRAFAAKGAGTVVTGTLLGGSVAVDDELVLLPSHATVRIRSLQSLHTDRERIGPGNRTALNLGGVAHDEVERGQVLVRDGDWHETRMFDAELRVLDALDHEVSRRGAHVAYIGSGEHPVRLRVLGSQALEPGAVGPVRIHLPRALPLLPGDRFVLRESGRGETIGGGEILDVEPVLPASRAAPDRSVDRVIAERGWIEAPRLKLLTGEERAPDVDRWVVEPDELRSARERLARAVADAGGLGLALAELGERDRAVLAGLDGIELDGGRARPAESADPLADHPFLVALAASPFTPPAPDTVDRGELRELVRRGLVVESDGQFFAASSIDAAARVVAGLLAEHSDGVTVAQVREALGTTRKYAMPILATLDATGVTRRRGDVRIGGPRLPEP